MLLRYRSYTKWKLSSAELSTLLFPLHLCSYSATLKVLEENKVIYPMKSKLAHSNFRLQALVLANKRDPDNGIALFRGIYRPENGSKNYKI
jgi:hypothetical protein